jgi:spore coat polysaccharide biosynthesis protein SpsF
MNVVCIIQARMGSTRLPGKVLMNICGKTVLEHDIDRLRKVNNINNIVIATTELDRDNAIVKEAKRLNVNAFRGSEDDVLSRYYFASKKFNADIIVRVTSDCPLIDSEVTQDIIQHFIDNYNNCDYVSNTVKRTYPRGLDTEVFSFKSLERAYIEATSDRDREHVTPYIWDNPQIFRIEQHINKEDLSGLRWTLDTREDFELISRIYEYLYPTRLEQFNMEDIVELYNIDPILKGININIKQKDI